MQESPVFISLEFTPNPNTLKYAVNREVLGRGAISFKSLEEAQGKSPLAEKLLQVQGVESVMLGKDFVTVTKTEEGDWDVVHENCSQMIETHLTNQEPVLLGDLPEKTGARTEIEKKICEILDQDIRPAVAMDGGDISFDRFEDGTVFVHLQGSCAGCPSSTQTLKMGIEERLKKMIPEVQEVVAV